ncbi:hypothetical protein BO71DRAFT_436816 [Aspergillus ellipticus CBS 707.79]|uniref:Uncharacterized protein n=1 Tax=Aspergillus ellipticus CBS 707.79 TaxID=1448320 RepID=A0A319CS91_9EURO|nr:hypothetical protein BO71DRAFT_436816 [Aspergillus ellipticus CBS 707.79]
MGALPTYLRPPQVISGHEPMRYERSPGRTKVNLQGPSERPFGLDSQRSPFSGPPPSLARVDVYTPRCDAAPECISYRPMTGAQSPASRPAPCSPNWNWNCWRVTPGAALPGA